MNLYSFETTHPGTVELEPMKKYALTGLINGKPKFFSYPKACKTKIQVPFINPGKTQSILEIWSSSKSMEPKFSTDWKILQFIFAQNCTYHGISDLNDSTRFSKARRVHIFRISQKNPDSRFIWLSNDAVDFWDNPVSNFDDDIEFAKNEVIFLVNRFFVSNFNFRFPLIYYLIYIKIIKRR